VWIDGTTEGILETSGVDSKLREGRKLGAPGSDATGAEEGLALGVSAVMSGIDGEGRPLGIDSDGCEVGLSGSFGTSGMEGFSLGKAIVS